MGIPTAKELSAEICKRLGHFGFIRKFSTLVYELEKDEVYGMVSFTFRHYPRECIICSPLLGVSHLLITNIYSELFGAISHPFPQVVLSLPHSWSFSGENDEATMNHLVANISKHGVSFFRAAKTVPGLIKLLRKGCSNSEDYSLPLALYVEGEYATAKKFMKSRLSSKRNPADPDYAKFCKKIDRLITQEQVLSGRKSPMTVFENRRARR